MTYQETLKQVQKQNPDKPYKECQQIAKKIFSAYKEGIEKLNKSASSIGIPPEEKPPVKTKLLIKETLPYAGSSDPSELYALEKLIRQGGYDVNKICSLGRSLIQDGKIVRHGHTPNGVNSYVSFEDEAGNRLPLDGYFIVYL
jgi:hypothetical protein